MSRDPPARPLPRGTVTDPDVVPGRDATEAATGARRDLVSYDTMMGRYSPQREARFQVMIDLVLAGTGAAPSVLDVACGPGSLADRLVRRSPEAHVVAADVDPTMLAIARGVAAEGEGRLNVVELDVLADDWRAVLGSAPFDAVVMASATHYLDHQELHHVYRQARAVLAPGGMLVNGDEMAWPADQSWCTELATRLRGGRDEAAPEWDEWWAQREAQPARDGQQTRTVDDHLRALRSAGFHECGVMWQHLDSHVLVARSGSPPVTGEHRR